MFGLQLTLTLGSCLMYRPCKESMHRQRMLTAAVGLAGWYKADAQRRPVQLLCLEARNSSAVHMNLSL